MKLEIMDDEEESAETKAEMPKEPQLDASKPPSPQRNERQVPPVTRT